ncbi:hypothetical protein [Salinibacter altiplanensis]|uniref:hypothetical protein n=1 Tax=Salinibacter altiplanensis TaxID=1803181 RepID=UPI001E5FC9D1|nr:hypothetical protein [Salinibacter altiplanensis]
MPASPHTAPPSDVPDPGTIVALNVPPAAVGLHRMADRGDPFHVVDVEGTELVVTLAGGDGRTYRLRLGHVQAEK